MPRILLVDDDPDISLALADFLQKEKFEVEVANTGNVALEKGLTANFEAVLLDVGLPDRDGLEILVEFAKQKPALPIVLLTAFTSLSNSTPQDILNKAFASLTKPYSREAILQVLHQAIPPAKKSESQIEPLSHLQNSSSFPSIIQPSPGTKEKTRGPYYQLSLKEYQRLAENIQLMQFAFDHVPEAILIADADKRFRFANQAAYHILGYSQEELETLGIADIAPSHDNQRYQEHLHELRHGKTLSYYTTHPTKSGQNIPVEISVNLLKFQGQEFTCANTKHTPSQPTPL